MCTKIQSIERVIKVKKIEPIVFDTVNCYDEFTHVGFTGEFTGEPLFMFGPGNVPLKNDKFPEGELYTVHLVEHYYDLYRMSEAYMRFTTYESAANFFRTAKKFNNIRDAVKAADL